MVYCAEEATGALLEALVHLEVESLEGLPRSYQLMRIALPAKIATEEVELSSLPADWKRRTLLTRSIGDAWLAAGRTPALRVPSAVSPHAFNVLLNPALASEERFSRGRPERRAQRLVSKSRHPFDNRLFRAIGASARCARRRGRSGGR